MSILLIPLTYMVVMGLVCMGPAGWIALAFGLELFGWTATHPRVAVPRQPTSPRVIAFALVFIAVMTAIVVLPLIFPAFNR